MVAGSAEVAQVATPTSVEVLNVIGCAVQPAIAVAPLKNSTFPEIAVTAELADGATVAVKVTVVFTGTGLEEDTSAVVVGEGATV